MSTSPLRPIVAPGSGRWKWIEWVAAEAAVRALTVGMVASVVALFGWVVSWVTSWYFIVNLLNGEAIGPDELDQIRAWRPTAWRVAAVTGAAAILAGTFLLSRAHVWRARADSQYPRELRREGEEHDDLPISRFLLCILGAAFGVAWVLETTGLPWEATTVLGSVAIVIVGALNGGVMGFVGLLLAAVWASVLTPAREAISDRLLGTAANPTLDSEPPQPT